LHHPEHARIETVARILAKLVHRILEAHAFAVRACLRDRVENVGRGDDACSKRDRFTLEAARIAGAVPTLVV